MTKGLKILSLKVAQGGGTMPIVQRARDSPLNGQVTSDHGQDWFLLGLGKVEGGIKPFINISEGLKNDPHKPEHQILLQLLNSAVKEKRWSRETPNYWILSSSEEGELLAGLLVSEDKVVAPAPENITTRHLGAPFLFEVRKRGRVKGKVLAALTKGKLECLGNREELRPFLS